MVKRKLTVGGLIGYLANVKHFRDNYSQHAISLWNMIPGSLLPNFNEFQKLLLLITTRTLALS